MIKFGEILIHLSRNFLQINFLSCYVYDIFHTVQLHSNHGNRYSLAIFHVFEQKMVLRRHCCLDLASTRARRRLGRLQYQICRRTCRVRRGNNCYSLHYYDRPCAEEKPGSILGHNPDKYRFLAEKSVSYQDNTGTSRITLGVVKSFIRTIRVIFRHYADITRNNARVYIHFEIFLFCLKSRVFK